jgi:hypothetical protein
MRDAAAAAAVNPFQQVVICGSCDLLSRIREPAVELAIWSRRLPETLARWLDVLPPECLPHGRLLVALPDLDAALTALLNESQTPAGPMRTAFQDDVVNLCDAFAEATAATIVDVRLEAIRHDGCWKFHRDCVEARLLTTYRGPGTQWIWPEDAEAALSLQNAFRGRVNDFPPQAVGLFKGSRSSSGAGIVHRSPPISGSGATRLLLCVNLPTPASPGIWTGT